jgi:MauM/NapG family ferredoxin protein
MSKKPGVNRRALFNLGGSKKKEVLIAFSEEVLGTEIKRTEIRPPGAIAESEFLKKCTHCRECANACPHEIILFIEHDHEPLKAGTPLIDPYEDPCQFCEGMPCIEACEPNALVLEGAPPMGVVEFHKEHCLVAQGQRCDYCYRHCPSGVKAIRAGDDGMPIINSEECVGCGKCVYYCTSQSGKALTLENVD